MNEMALGKSGTHGPLLQWLDTLAAELTVFSDDLTNRYFSHTVPRIS
jgi:hypothetical protein